MPKIIAAINITLKNLDTFPGSLLTNARIIKYKVAAPKVKNTKNLIILLNLSKSLIRD